MNEKSSIIDFDSNKTLRELLISENFYLSSVISSTFTKIGLKISNSKDFEEEEKNKLILEVK
jgi:hypothetical protein